ncbi:JNK-interacting protein 1-like [Amphibalanus amphitrite]|nr:JNK-interacting protein 1-like [Amphibalanus amphitrite]
MADLEFEEFRRHFDRLPQHIKAPEQSYRLVHDVAPGGPTAPESSSEGDSAGEETSEETRALHSGRWEPSGWAPAHEPADTDQHRQPQRRRRLPEIPKSKRPLSRHLRLVSHLSLASELGILEAGDDGRPAQPVYVMKCSHLSKDGDSSPDSDVLHTCTDGDSGNSTAHSPDNCCRARQRNASGAMSPVSPSAALCTKLELLEATHRGLYKFEPRHHDEITIDIGDPVYLIKEADDLWCTGVNLRTGLRGVFPSAYVTDVDYADFDPSAPPVRKERYLLGYLGSVEARKHKGIEVITQAVQKVIGDVRAAPDPADAAFAYPCILEISDQGVRMIDKSKPAPNHVLCHDYFYEIKNVSFCGFHPQNRKYFGFVTKHPQDLKFACHVFVSEESTRPVAEAVGRAFQRFYQKYLEAAYPIEEIFMDF